MRLAPFALAAGPVLALTLGCSSADTGTGSPGAPRQWGPTPTPTSTTPNANNPSPTPTTTPTTPTPTTTDETWSDGKQLSGAIMIMSGATVTIAPGAKITAAAGTSISVAGKLVVSSQSAHASITGTGWSGVTVASGGTLAAVGLDLSGAGITVNGGATAASFDYGKISAASTPFNVAAGAKLTTSHASVSAAGPTSVGGELDASYLDYDTNGSEGIYSMGTSTVIKIDDSRLYGIGNTGGDMISISGAQLVHLAHTEIHGVHCAFHFNDVTSVDLSFMDIHDNSYGFMLYGSQSTGTRTIASSNIYNNVAYGADEGSANTQNGLITFQNGYWSNNGPNGGTAADNLRRFTTAITATNMSTTTKVTGTGPR